MIVTSCSIRDKPFEKTCPKRESIGKKTGRSLIGHGVGYHTVERRSRFNHELGGIRGDYLKLIKDNSKIQYM